MNLQRLDNVILAMCEEVHSHAQPSQPWENLSEDQLLYEAVVCIAGSQMLFEMAVGIADRLKNANLLTSSTVGFGGTNYQAKIVKALTRPLLVGTSSGKTLSCQPRFKNRLATLIATTVSNIYTDGMTIAKILNTTGGVRRTRESLVAKVCGFGPKQASLFLRRIGYSADLAVLDVHVLDYLALAKGISVRPSALQRLHAYERIEAEFIGVANQFGHTVGCVDLATWITMRVAKREAYL